MLSKQNTFFSSKSTFFRRYSLLMLFSGLIFLYFLPLLISGEDSYITIHDNLDSGVVLRVVLSRNNVTVNDSGTEVVPQIMGGIPRAYLVSDLNIIMLLFKIFNPFWAYLINHVIVHVVAFLGMYLFVSHYLITSQRFTKNSDIFCLGISFAFSVLPFYTMYGLSVAGQPILLFSFLNIAYHKGRFTDFLTLLVFPFYSFLFLNGGFLIIELFMVLLYFVFVKARLTRTAVLGWLIFSIMYFIVEHDFIRSIIINPSGITHRADWNLSYGSTSIWGVIDDISSMFIHGQYHASSHHEIILIIIVGVLAISIKDVKKHGVILLLLFTQLIIAIIYGFYNWNKLIPIKSLLGIFSSFNWGRISMQSPFIWYCLFFLSLIALLQYQKLGYSKNRILIFSLIIIQIGVNLLHNPEYGSNINTYIKIPAITAEEITYRQFFSANLFHKIADVIGLPKEDYRVASIGIHPSIAQYNGFYTLDGYLSIYPLVYKQQFRKIIAQELAKNRTWQEYFDYWGSRCYLLSSEIPDFLSTKDKGRIITHLEINTQAFIDLGGRFIFSAAEVLNYKDEDLNFVGVFTDRDSVWQIFVYEATNKSYNDASLALDNRRK